MDKQLKTYIQELGRQFATGNATEHSHRPALKTLLEAVIPDILATNEPKHIACGAPDFVLTRKGIPFGYVEAKDIGISLDAKDNKEQIAHYSKSLDNLIYTDYLEFRLIRDGKQVATVKIAEVSGKRIKPNPANFAAFADIIYSFAEYHGQTITSANDLAKRMAVKAKMLASVITKALIIDDRTAQSAVSQANNDLQSQLQAFRQYLIHDIEPANFADIYAQTVAYGMFAARLHDPTPTTFSRQEAADLIPEANPFLRNFFQQIAGYNLDQRIHWIVDDLADIFRAADIGELMKDYGKATQRNDPFLHFYETFLGEYDSKLRKSRGVYYTPEPVVDFIVRAVDEILRNQFGTRQGLADNAKITIQVDAGRNQNGKPETRPQEIHKVQILDPATGTGTFLAAIVKHIEQKYFAKQKGTWPDYAKQHLIPRLNGFEVLMAPYAMAHTKLGMVLRDSGCKLDHNRLNIFLTNTLEEHHPDTKTVFAQWLSNEANQANRIKRDTPVMVVIGNPPYSGESANKGEWITDLLTAYKQEPSGGKLQERNSKWINDDYVKFMRYGQYLVDKTGEGILAYINNHGFLDNPTFRGMRWSLLQSFDEIYIIDLHGNTKKKETAPDGSADKNVFDIQQGVSINLFIKTGKKKHGALASVSHYDLYGERESKYQFLWEHNLSKINFRKLTPQAPQYFFVLKDYGLQGEYEKGFSVSELFTVNSVGIVTARDSFTIYHRPAELQNTIAAFRRMDDETARDKYALGKDARDWKIYLARKDLEDNVFHNNNDNPVPICYRPFDARYTYYTGNSKGFHCMPRGNVMRHFIAGENVGMIFHRREEIKGDFAHIFVSRFMTEHGSTSSKTTNYQAPLYLYPDNQQKTLDSKQSRTPNLNADIVQTIATTLGLRFTPEKENDNQTFAPIDLLDYLYAVLHSPTYRKRYKEFLKIDYPRVPYPTDQTKFRKLIALGEQLRTLHLMESPILNTPITNYPTPGDHLISKPKFEITDFKNRLGKVHINSEQYFEKVPETAWNFYIGGYQPAQKWLKDRKGRNLTHDDITHYQKIILALTETARLMEKIDKLH